MPSGIYTGLSYPFRIGTKGRAVMSSAYGMDVSHINESIEQILLTNQGERVNEPEFGADLLDLLFENIDEALANMIAHKVEQALERWEPRIEVLDIQVQEINGGVEITVYYRVVTTLLETQTTVFFERTAE